MRWSYWRNGLFSLLFLISPAQAADPANSTGSRFSDAEIFTALGLSDFTVAAWWAKQPDRIKNRLRQEPLEMWRPVILCSYQGFDMTKPDGQACEKEAYDRRYKRGNMWGEGNQFVGPSDDCLKRNKRTQYGELICD